PQPGPEVRPADQVVVGRVPLDADWRTGNPAVVDQHVDLVPRQALLLLKLPRRGRAVRWPRLLGFSRRPEVVQVFRQVRLDLLDEGEDVWLVSVLLGQLCDERADGNERHLPIERRDALLSLLLDLPHLAHGSANLAL